jgi:hypothetical protein
MPTIGIGGTCNTSSQWITVGGLASGSSYYTWNSISSTSQTLVNGNAYIPTSSSLTTFTLPSSPALGDHYSIVGSGSGGWRLVQNASQVIYYGNTNTTTGVSGSLSSTLPRDEIEVICISSNTFEVINSIGSINVV